MRWLVMTCLPMLVACSIRTTTASRSTDSGTNEATGDGSVSMDAGAAQTRTVECGAPTGTFYSLTGPLPADNGAVMKCERADPADGGSLWAGYLAYRIQYKSSQVLHDSDGGTRTVDVPASGEVFVPVDGGGPYVLAETHGTSGIISDPSCAPTGIRWVDTPAMPAMASAAPAGVVVVAPDYFGMGTDDGERTPDHTEKFPDPLGGAEDTPLARVSHPYFSLESEGRATVDLVRAARFVPEANTGAAPAWLVYGVSQGGHAALGTGEVVRRGYGSEMKLVGIVAAEPGSELDYGVPYSDGGAPDEPPDADIEPDLALYLYEEVFAGLSLENPFQCRDLYTEYALGAFSHTAGSACQGDTGWVAIDNAYLQGGHPWYQRAISPSEYDFARGALTTNSPGHAPSPDGVPALVIQVAGDPVVRKERTDILVSRERATNPGEDWTYCLWQGTNLTEPDGGPTPYTARSQNHDGLGFAFGKYGVEAPVCVGADGATTTESPDYVRTWTRRAFAKP
jgi:hypothetical protein